MSFRATTLRRLHLVAFLLALISGPVFGQAADSPVAFANQSAVVASFVDPINFGGTEGSSGSSDSKWLKVEFHFGTTDKLLTPYLDEVQFRVWIEGRDLQDPQAKPEEGIAVGLTGDVTYINVPKGKDIYGVFFVHPSTLGRYAAPSGVSDYERKFNVHVEAYVGGKLVDAIDKIKDPDPTWYQKVKAIPGLVYRQNQSPFINSDVSHYPAIKLPPSMN